MVNVPLLRKVLEHITEHPNEHDQTDWATRVEDCGTTMCVGGHAVAMTGYEIVWPSDHRYIGSATCKKDGDVWGRSIEGAAMEELGLSSDQADQLFNGNNTLQGLWHIASHLTCDEIEVPERFL